MTASTAFCKETGDRSIVIVHLINPATGICTTSLQFCPMCRCEICLCDPTLCGCASSLAHGHLSVSVLISRIRSIGAIARNSDFGHAVDDEMWALGVCGVVCVGWVLAVGHVLDLLTGMQRDSDKCLPLCVPPSHSYSVVQGDLAPDVPLPILKSWC